MIYLDMALTIVYLVVAIHYQRRYHRLRAVLLRCTWDLARRKENLKVATDSLEAVFQGYRLVVTKAADGMTLEEAQRELDRIVGIFYKPEGSA